MFEKFTDRARKVMKLAKEHAERRQSDEIETHHLLLAIIDERGGVGVKALLQCGVNLEDIKERTCRVIQALRENFKPMTTIPFSLGMKKVIALANERAPAMKMDVTGTGHLLVALWELDGKPGSYFLLSNVVVPNIGLDQLERAVAHVLRSDGNDEPPPAKSIHPAPIPTKETAERRLTRESPHLAALLPAIQSIMMWDEYYKFAMNGLIASAELITPEDIVKRAGELADLSMKERTKRDNLPPLQTAAVPMAEAAVAVPQEDAPGA